MGGHHQTDHTDESLRRGLAELLPRLRRFARGLSGSVDQADDLVQAACERALDRAHQWRPGTRLDSWLFRIVQTIWIDGRRAANVRGEHLDVVDPATLSDDRPARRVEAELTLVAVRKAILALPDHHRAVLLLVCVEGMAYRDASDVLGIPVGTVMSRLARARLALNATLNAGDGNGSREVDHGVV